MLRRVNRSRAFMAIVLALVGVVWTLQGFGVIAGKSFMVGDPFWAVVGVALIVGAGVYMYWPVIRSRRR
jgi:ABC-type nickel/cobalt efflux system permease component RcnA